MAGRDPAFAGGRPDEPPAGTPAAPAIVIVLVAAIRGEGRRVAAKPFRLLRAVVCSCTRSCCRLWYGMHADEMRPDVAGYRTSHRPRSKQELPTAGHSGTIMAKKAADAR